MNHGLDDVQLAEGANATYICVCGERRSGDIVEAGKLMREHEDAMRWRDFQEMAFQRREITLLGRKVQL